MKIQPAEIKELLATIPANRGVMRNILVYIDQTNPSIAEIRSQFIKYSFHEVRSAVNELKRRQLIEVTNDGHHHIRT